MKIIIKTLEFEEKVKRDKSFEKLTDERKLTLLEIYDLYKEDVK